MHISTILLVLEKYMLPCFTKKIFGFDCPGCGIQRALVFLVKGDFSAAYSMYPAIFPMVALLVFVLVATFTRIKFELPIKIGLAVITGLTVIVSYIFKINHLIN